MGKYLTRQKYSGVLKWVGGHDMVWSEVSVGVLLLVNIYMSIRNLNSNPIVKQP